MQKEKLVKNVRLYKEKLEQIVRLTLELQIHTPSEGVSSQNGPFSAREKGETVLSSHNQMQIAHCASIVFC